MKEQKAYFFGLFLGSPSLSRLPGAGRRGEAGISEDNVIGDWGPMIVVGAHVSRGGLVVRSIGLGDVELLDGRRSRISPLAKGIRSTEYP